MKATVTTLVLASIAMLLSALLIAVADAAPQSASRTSGGIEQPDKPLQVEHVGMGENQPLR